LKHSRLEAVGRRVSAACSAGLSCLIWLSLFLQTGSVALGATTPAFVQKKDNQITSGLTNRVALSAPTVAGNLVVVYLIWDNTGSAFVSDSLGNTYASAAGSTRWSNGKYSAQIFYVINLNGGPDTITATFATSVNSFGIVYAHEYSGVRQTAPLDVTVAAIGTSGSLSSGSATTTNDTELLFAGGVSASFVTSPGAGYTARATSQGNMTEDKMVSAKGSYSATASNSGGAWAMQMVAFKGMTSGISDATPPTVPTGLSAIAVTSSQITLSWIASTDPDNPPSQIAYGVYQNGTRIAITAAGATSWAVTGLAASTTYSYTLTASDPAGNNSAQTAPVSATTKTSDTQAPTVSITSPANNQTVSGITTISANAADNVAVVGVQFQLDGGNLGAEVATSPYSTSWNTSQTTNGSHLSTAVARDAAGNKTTSSGITLTVTNASLRPYNTNFPLTENPISESGNWINGGTTGLDWSNVATSPGLAHGTVVSAPPPYNDSTAVLTGTWASNQTAQAVVSTSGNCLTASVYEEVELRLRTTITAHSITGYEFNFRCDPGDGAQYVYIVRWNGPLNSFTTVAGSQPLGPGVKNGDVLMATAVGSTLTAYINGVQILQGTDSTYANGSPGIGFFNQGGTLANNNQYGFANFSASDTTSSSSIVRLNDTRTVKTTGNSYTTNFSLSENLISERGKWINGRVAGLDWANVRTKPGLAFGTETDTVNYDDSTAILAGSWGANQMAQAKVHTVNQSYGLNEEVELRLRTSISTHSITGSEISFRCTSDGTQYAQIVRWNGPLGDFTFLASVVGPGLHDGDVVKATMVGTTITAYINGAQIIQATDSTYTTGSPGMGFYIQGGTAAQESDYGFTSYTASDTP
jgi:chitodextrinase